MVKSKIMQQLTLKSMFDGQEKTSVLTQKNVKMID